MTAYVLGDSEEWTAYVAALTGLRTDLARLRAVNVTRAEHKAAARAVVEQYFRRTRPELIRIGLTPEELVTLDGEMQALLRLSNGNNRRQSYRALLDRVRALELNVAARRELLIGEQRDGPLPSGPDMTPIEARIVETLGDLVPSAALSYTQALHDLGDETRVSFRGTANELREALREVLDRLAPDEVVTSEPSFALEDNQTKPTQRQKVRYILRSRGASENERRVPEEHAALIDALIASATRSVMQRGSLSTHVAAARGDVAQLKMYIDGVLTELLEIHR